MLRLTTNTLKLVESEVREISETLQYSYEFTVQDITESVMLGLIGAFVKNTGMSPKEIMVILDKTIKTWIDDTGDLNEAFNTSETTEDNDKHDIYNHLFSKIVDTGYEN